MMLLLYSAADALMMTILCIDAAIVIYVGIFTIIGRAIRPVLILMRSF